MTACGADGYPVPDSIVKTGRRVARNAKLHPGSGLSALCRRATR